ncbi:TIGR03759 family integrating conjugative element protein [Gallibacterium anatis]|uniref:TIGR03759 family integrating conjugative element protein n=1 Tax=Gallibacterium anatis TaxID=750 RepID=UPI0039FD6573
MKKRNILLILSLALGQSAFALDLNETVQSIKETSAKALAQAEQSAKQVSSSVTSTIQSLSANEQAQHWGLTEEEWKRYELLKKTERQYWSPNLDPLTTLGVEATSEAERQKYARLLAKKEFERVEKELKFQLAYDAAFKELYPGVMPISDNTMSPVINERLVLFTRLNCEKCDSALQKILATNKSVDIYFVDSRQDDKAIRDWAISHRIDVNKVRSRQITLNHDQGDLWMQHGNGKMPVIFKSGTWDQVNDF